VPAIDVVFFREDDGRVPALETILAWARRDLRVASKCFERIETLRALGHELRRPAADYLRDGIHELRSTFGTVHYRVLYFFEGGKAVIACAVAKEGSVPDKDIDQAVKFHEQFRLDAVRHTYDED
jgi:hypothetical protein